MKCSLLMAELLMSALLRSIICKDRHRDREAERHKLTERYRAGQSRLREAEVGNELETPRQ